MLILDLYSIAFYNPRYVRKPREEGIEHHMARVIGVHGVGHQFSGPNTLRKEWLPALKDGLALANRGLASDDDFACAFYGELFRPAGKAAGDPPFDASDVAEDWERALLELWWREAARIDPEVRGPDAHQGQHAEQRAAGT